MTSEAEDLPVRPMPQSSPPQILRLFGDADMVRCLFVGGSVGC